jgi:hypothetical protein
MESMAQYAIHSYPNLLISYRFIVQEHKKKGSESLCRDIYLGIRRRRHPPSYPRLLRSGAPLGMPFGSQRALLLLCGRASGAVLSGRRLGLYLGKSLLYTAAYSVSHKNGLMMCNFGCFQSIYGIFSGS